MSEVAARATPEITVTVSAEQIHALMINSMASVILRERAAVMMENPQGSVLRPSFEERLRVAGFTEHEIAAFYDAAVDRAIERDHATSTVAPAEAAAEGLAQATPEPSPPEPLLPLGFQWACVEVFGHRRHFGRCAEEERFGAKMLRVDVPEPASDVPLHVTWTTHYYGGGAIFSYTLTDEETVMSANRRHVSPYAKRIAPPQPQAADADDADEVLDGVDACAVKSDDDRPF
ncbi:hypothetical protein [Rhodoplanes roseus]|uniref:hypothetical protein n=1 Tax=Rhodoplanes roseus TaxID=29409 RepID=UPI001AECA6CB|nr:hypothetical protein [Rhodoplanes roseus]